MGLYNFKERFVPRILDGSKTHTIRPRRSRADKPGNTLHLYTGLRHKGARLLMRVPCVKVEEIEIDACGHECNCDPMIAIDGIELSESEREAFAIRDGFESFDDFMNFWAGRLPFKGQIVHWKAA
jgi:ASCH domain-containing protein